MASQPSLTFYQRTAYEAIIAKGEAALARWSASNPMRARVEANVADARAQLVAA